MRIMLIVSLFTLQGCVYIDTRDAPWDPKGSAQLIDQIPNWDNAAERICGGHLGPVEARRQGKSTRC